MSETPTPYASPLPQYLAEAKRDAFLAGVGWVLAILEHHRPGDSLPTPEDIERAARAYAGLPVNSA